MDLIFFSNDVVFGYIIVYFFISLLVVIVIIMYSLLFGVIKNICVIFIVKWVLVWMLYVIVMFLGKFNIDWLI